MTDNGELPGDRWAPHPSPPFDHDRVTLPRGRTLGYAQYGDPDGDAVFWFHGTPGGRFQVPPDVNDQAIERSMRVIALERPGVGLSTPHRYDHVADWATDVARAADALDADRFGLIGLSGGGPYVLACAHDLPERTVAGVVLGGIGPTRGSDRIRSYTQLLPSFEPLLSLTGGLLGTALRTAALPLRLVRRQSIDLYTNLLARADKPAFESPGMKDMFIHDLCEGMESSLDAPVLDIVLFGRHWGFALEDIKAPIVFVQGDTDHIVPYVHGEQQAQRVPDSELIARPGEGHFAGFLELDTLLDRIRDRC